MFRAHARVGRVGFAALLRGGSCDGGSRGGVLLDPRGRLDGPTGRCGTQERPRRRLLLVAHLARYLGRALCRPVWPDLSWLNTTAEPLPGRSNVHATLISTFASCTLLHLIHNESI